MGDCKVCLKPPSETRRTPRAAPESQTQGWRCTPSRPGFFETTLQAALEARGGPFEGQCGGGSACTCVGWPDRHSAGWTSWDGIPLSALRLPLDVHTGNVGRQLGLLRRKASDWRAVEEVTDVLRMLDPDDPVRYDFALFGMGVTGVLDLK